jgi:hypothetical protein
MTGYDNPLRKRGLTAVSAAMVLIILLLMVQMYLLVATLENYLAGNHAAAIPGAVLSGLLFAASAALLAFVLKLDKGSGPSDSNPPPA